MDSILSSGERDVAERLGAGQSVAEIATARDTSSSAVEQAIDRIREKTNRAIGTLLESPVADEAVAALEPEQRSELRSVIE